MNAGTVERRDIRCCGCGTKVSARLTTGKEVYPYRNDLADRPFWKCDGCDNFVGCHYKTKDRTRPLGCIPTPEIKNARQHIHKLLDSIWKSGRMTRNEIYSELSTRLGWKYHTACIRSVEEGRAVYRHLKDIIKHGQTNSQRAADIGEA